VNCSAIAVRMIPGVVVAVLATTPAAAAGVPAMGTISGVVQNHTGATRPAAGLPVTLSVLVNGAAQEPKDAVTDTRGRFSFTVTADPQRSYVAKITYKGGEYESRAITFKAGETARQTHMRVYEPTSDPSVLKVTVHHIIVEPGEGALQVAELLVFTNGTDRTYVGGQPRADGKRETLRFTLPTGAANLQYMEGLMECCVSATKTGLVDTMDVEPGMREIAYSYTVPVSRATLTLPRRLDYAADRVEVFGSGPAQLAVTPLARQSDVTTEQGVYARYSGASVAAGTDVRLAFSGLPVSRALPRRTALAAFAGLIAAALVFPFLRRPRRQVARPTATQTREDLIRGIAALDDRFEAGALSEEEYRARRTSLLDQIRGPAA